MLKSNLFSLAKADFWKGLVMAVLTPVLYLVQELIPGWHVDPIVKAAISATIAYLIKNFCTDSTKEAIKTINKAGGTISEAETDDKP